MNSERIGIRELRTTLSQAMRRVRAGTVVEVTDRGRPIARIVPIVAGPAGLDRLVTAGTLRPPTSSDRLPMPLDLPSTMTSEEAIDMLRGS
jgi:prevent-host-death family protein